MVPALSLKLLKNRVKEKYESDEKRIVGIMLARYELSKTQRLIKENYGYWHNNTGKGFDIFWAEVAFSVGAKSKNVAKEAIFPFAS